MLISLNIHSRKKISDKVVHWEGKDQEPDFAKILVEEFW